MALDTKSESRAYRLFKNSIKRSTTLINYDRCLKAFCGYTGLTYDEIVKLDTEDLQMKLEDWVMDLNLQNLRQNTIETMLSAVEKFLDMNRKLYYKKVVRSLIKRDEDIGGGTEPFTNDEIKRI